MEKRRVIPVMRGLEKDTIACIDKIGYDFIP